MKAPQAPHLDERRTEEFAAELRERAQAWTPTWALADGERDFGRALLQIAARFSSDVAEHLDVAGDKMRRGFLDWLGIPRIAARSARLPVVFKLADAATEAVLASAPVQLQADTAGASVVFETEQDVRVVPGRVELVVGTDAEADAFYRSPRELNDLQPLQPLPTQWIVKSFAAVGTTKLQLDPDSGLNKDMIVEAADRQYQINNVENDIVTIEPELATDLPQFTMVCKVTDFAPFDKGVINWQEHALYLGDMERLNIEAAATIDVVGATALVTGITWQYWGKVEGSEESGWQTLTVAPIDEQKPDAVVLKKEKKGEVEPKKIDEKNSRWIRAYTKKVEGTAPQLQSDALKIRVNCIGNPPCPPPDSAAPGPSPEAMVNNIPLVLSEPFYPLGREPHQFDAFYLGCAEAFSKKDAVAQVCFEMSDATCRAYTPVRAGLFANQGVLAGVGKDRALHLFKLNPANGAMTAFRGPLRPPLPAAPGVDVKQSTPVDLNLRCRPVIWNAPANGDDFFVAVAAAGNIWIWHESASDPKNSGWSRHSSVPDLVGKPAEIEDIIVLKSNPDRPGAVLSNGRFWVFDGTNWIQPLKPPLPGTPLRDYAALAPIYDGNLDLTNSMVAVSATKKLYRLETNGTEVDLLLANLDVGDVSAGSSVPVGGIRPAAIDDGQLLVVAVTGSRDELVAIKPGSQRSASLGTNLKAIGAEVSISQVGGKLQFSVGVRMAADRVFVASWVPTFAAGTPPPVFQSPIPDALGDIGGTPLTLGSYIVVPGGRGDAFVAPFNPAGRLPFTTKVIVEAVTLPAPAPFAVNDFISVLPKNMAHRRKEWTVTKPPSARGTTDVLYVVEPAFGESVADNPQLIGYSISERRVGTIQSNTKFHPNTPLDPAIVPGAILRIVVGAHAVTFCEVDFVDPATHNVVVKAATPLPGQQGNALSYWKPHPFPATVFPAIEFDPAGDGNWDAALLDTAKLYFPASFQPSPQQGTAFGLVGNHPRVVALAQRWTVSPPFPFNAPTPFIIDAVRGVWQHQLADSSSNPALSWEYWNGKGWWSLELTDDGTERFANTGAVQFKVPQDIAESDWAGKTNFWIRARLVGGDYGHEEVKVISKPGVNSGETEQVVVRSTENIKAPQVLNLGIAYSICDAVLPKFVLAQDSGSYRDQSAANQVDGAIVEAFVPLALTLGRLERAAAALPAPGDCPPECDDPSPPTAAAQPLPDAIAVPAAQPARGRAIFIGVAGARPDAPAKVLSEGPVNVLMLVDERKHTSLAPMVIAALAADHFDPIVAHDTTRALGESGLLSMVFADPPTPRELFGQTLTWLRLTPKEGTNAADWNLALRGAYLNAVWASATETLTRELLGSSDGTPNMSVRLARPPVLDHTLELRVKEPLGEEERVALRKADKASVLNEVDGLPGDWVLWKQVADPNDEAADARVYALDEATGEIRFGDGRHGRIPPIGRDAIVAFSYKRTEPGPSGSATVPGNLITARTALNLVSPVATVESVTAADQAAGGAPPEDDDRVLRFGYARLRHRNRAVMLHDLEDLAVQSSPDVVQARALVRRGSIRLVVVMKGRNPVPTAAQVRELGRLLLASAPVSLSAPNALQIKGPEVRSLRIRLQLRVETLDHAGNLGRYVTGRLADFFDTATGGIDRDGWAMGLSPSADDIAFALIDAPHLDSIEDVKLDEIALDGSEKTWPDTLKPTELTMLHDDWLRIQFETTEVER